MIIERDLTPYVVYSGDPVLRALEKITANKARVIFLVDSHGHLDGVLSDGDFRRWVSTAASLTVDVPAIEAANTSPRSLPIGSSPAEISHAFGSGIDHVALVDDRGHLVAVAINRADELRIGRHVVAADAPTLLISEIGINHQGDVSLAKRLVDLSVEAGADVVKFQLRDMESVYRQGSSGSGGEDLGPQYTLDLLAKYNLEADQLFEVFDHCRDVGVDVMCTAWDPVSVDRLVDYGVPSLKVASADMTNHALLRHMAASGTPMVISTGMSTEGEIRETVDVVRSTGVPHAFLHCQSTYPAPFKDVNLAYLTRLAELTQAPVGYSGHERGFHVPVAAVALGARIIEKHFTVDRDLEGNDHKVSLLPGEFREMVQRVREVEEALGTAAPRAVSTGEMMNRVNLAKSLVAARRIEVGEVLTAADVDIKSPGRGLQPNAFDKLVGRATTRVLEAGDFFYATDLGDAAPKGRAYDFRRPWGLAVRYHDVDAMTKDTTPDFLEFHFSYKDLDLPVEEVFAAYPDGLPMGFTTHSPDLFAGDFLLNLASEDDAHWERSIRELQRVVDTTREMQQHFTRHADAKGASEGPVIVASLGGFTTDAFVAPAERERMYARVAAGLARVDDSGVRLCAQTLPPYPWYMGGQLYCNLFVDPRDTAAFAEQHDRRLCFDVSHSKLSANYLGMSFGEATDLLAPHTEHLHLVDATGVDGEGVQVGDGEIDWAVLAQQLDAMAPGVSFIPEIWQGHVNDGEGFWIALERLEQWF
ncbi:N-acetylneuraminate synthase family protein [Nocardioides okcheonensis]|uniref:N-acetylneuraminate synthase family protein n=1 Tax=Nocardioides okcheonensis TaxID=2894081 RepID=UPI001E326B5F|nr:N-acetylneuraminate synthase family protein [Nocardioides okcheonensis]UFN46570.1 N-acetylneuraminate synthase family protein [Nocardioides okcheonensis]